MKQYTLILITLFTFLSCSTNKKADETIDRILESWDRLQFEMIHLKGKWTGYYEELNPTYDTVFYNNIKEKLEFKLTNKVNDSSLIKELIIRDTFKLRRLDLIFNDFDTSSLSTTVQLIFGDSDSTLNLPVSLNLDENIIYETSNIQFGHSNHINSDSSLMIEMPAELNQRFFNDIFFSEYFTLTISKLTNDTLLFTLPYGQGKMVMTRKHDR